MSCMPRWCSTMGCRNHRITLLREEDMDEVRRWTALSIGLIAVMILAGCRFDQASARDKGVEEAASAIAAGQLKLKEYPPLPSPPGHGEYVQLLRERCGVEYEVPKLPPGVTKADFIQEVRGWNDTMRAEIMRKFGPGILQQLQEEGRKRWEGKVQSKGK